MLMLRGSAAKISIHAPRTGSDTLPDDGWTATSHFNPRSPHGERRHQPAAPAAGGRRFQSTLPARGATTDGDAQAPPRKISIHAPRTGSDRQRPRSAPSARHFNPRSPHGERRDR